MRTLFAAPAVALAGVLLVGCSSQSGPLAPATSASPKQALTDAVNKSGAAKDATVGMKLDTTSDDVTKMLNAMSSGTSATPSASSQQSLAVAAKVLPKLQATTKVHSNGGDLNTEKSPDKIDGSFALSVDGKPLEMMWVASQPYLHADVEGIGQVTGLFTSTQAKMMAESASKQMPWVNDIIDGKWVTLDKATSAKLVEKAKAQAASASPSATASVDPTKVRDAILDNSEVTKADDNNYKVVTDAKKLIKAYAAVSTTDDFDDADAEKALADINDGANLDSTVTVTDGKVSKVVVDLADVLRTWPKQKADQPSIAKVAATDFKLGGVIDLSTADAKVSAPSAATTIPAADVEKFINS